MTLVYVDLYSSNAIPTSIATFLPEMDVEVWSSCCSDSEDSDSDSDKDSPSSPLGDPGSSASDKSAKALVMWLVKFFLLLQARFHIRNFVLAKIFTFLFSCFRPCLQFMFKGWKLLSCNSLPSSKKL